MRRGLSEADAWKALTLWPAQIVGAGNQLGSIEAGKIANLVVASGDPLTGDSSNQWIVADGRLLPVHPAERPARGGDRAAGGTQ
jgi:imidazolonepropionase-like amidohydrolase